MKIVNITSMHNWYSERIYQRACVALVRKGHNVKLIATKDEGGIFNGVEIIPIKPRIGWRRRLFSSIEAFWKAFKTPADIYHFHDPDLLLLMLILKIFGRRVVYDIHDYYIVRFYQWNIPSLLRTFIIGIFKGFENFCIRKFDGIVTTTPSMLRLYEGVYKNGIVVYNDVDTTRLNFLDRSLKKVNFYDIYIAGEHSEQRHSGNIIKAMPYILEEIKDARIIYYGRYYDGYLKYLKELIGNLGLENNVELHGMIPWEDNIRRTAQAHLGCVFYEDNINNKVALPSRLFEYMYLGVPILASKGFPELESVVGESNCGLLVDSTSPEEIAKGAIEIFSNKVLAEKMGKNGKEAVRTKYNFKFDAERLIEIYQTILDQ